jgi:hypothetical protein
MGVFFEEELQRRYPEFPTRLGEWGWQDYLPPMNDDLRELIDRVEAGSSVTGVSA